MSPIVFAAFTNYEVGVADEIGKEEIVDNGQDHEEGEKRTS